VSVKEGFVEPVYGVQASSNECETETEPGEDVKPLYGKSESRDAIIYSKNGDVTRQDKVGGRVMNERRRGENRV
jgi:hypothetical protein